MKTLFGDKSDPELQAREALHHKKWGSAIAHYEKKLQDNERDFALWNLVGDLHMNNRARAQAVEAWRRALEGYALEGLYENALGIARKILRRAPEEEDVHLLLAEAYLGLEYHADCLAALRNYLKLSRRKSESDLRSLFKKVLEQPIPHFHLLEELSALYQEAGIEDIELERRLHEYVESARKVAKQHRPTEKDTRESEAEADPGTMSANGGNDLMTLGHMDTLADSPDIELTAFPSETAIMRTSEEPPEERIEPAIESDLADMPEGQGKDHYDLGLVYKEMMLWDAAIAEFEQAAKDPSVKTRATLALAECLQESGNLDGALQLLERESESVSDSPVEQLPLMHRLGIVHELLGNIEEALKFFEAVHKGHPDYGDVETRIAEIRKRQESDNAAE